MGTGSSAASSGREAAVNVPTAGYQAITVTASPHGEIHAITLTPRGEGQGSLVLRASTSQPGVMELCPAGSQVDGQGSHSSTDGTRNNVFADILQPNQQAISVDDNFAATASQETTVNPAVQNGEDRIDNRVTIRTLTDQPGLSTTDSSANTLSHTDSTHSTAHGNSSSTVHRVTDLTHSQSSGEGPSDSVSGTVNVGVPNSVARTRLLPSALEESQRENVPIQRTLHAGDHLLDQDASQSHMTSSESHPLHGQSQNLRQIRREPLTSTAPHRTLQTPSGSRSVLSRPGCLDNGQSAYTASLSFHPIHGSNVRLESDQKGLKSVAANVSQSMFNGFVFTYRPLQPGQILLIYILEADSSISNFDFGLTAVNPAALQQKDVPSSRAAASRRKEYWTFKYLEKLKSGDKLTFLLDRTGRVHYGVNGGDLQVVLEVETGQQLWAVFILTLFVRKIRLAGVVPADEPTPSSISPPPISADHHPDTEPRQPYRDDQTCAICYERPVNSVAYPCGHVCMCDRCGLLLKVQGANCPICRAPLFDVIKMYRA
ncbi:E3 ubiquitin-protein ligase neurl1b [Branchiostoma belcheri]|nr:E3 ubiquitin-protein ligase neurl1b [Branchiostoma belcheri]